MTNEEIFDLIACLDRSSVQTLKLTQQDFSIELSKSAGGAVCGSTASAPALAPSPAAPAAAGSVVKAPLVGTFYTAAAPDQPPFVSPGDRVSKGATLCLIEAMKMMSEVPAPCDCVIEEILQESGALVSFDAPLVRYRKV